MSTYGVKQANESKKATESKKANESKIECPDCHSMILKTNLAAHKKTKRHQNAVNPQSKENSKGVPVPTRQRRVREPSCSEEDEEDLEYHHNEQDDVDDLEDDDMSFEDEVMEALELLNNKLDQLLSLDVVTKIKQCMDEINKQSQASHQTTTNLIDHVRTHIIQEVKACNGGQPQFNVKTG